MASSPTSPDRYGSDVLASDWRVPRNGRADRGAGDQGEVVEEVTADFVVRSSRSTGTSTRSPSRTVAGGGVHYRSGRASCSRGGR